MGFNKKIYNKARITSWINSGKDLDILFKNADALIFCDEWSSNVHESYLSKKKKDVDYDKIKKSTTRRK
jgi:hypothetical protein